MSEPNATSNTSEEASTRRPDTTNAQSSVVLPRIAIKFCTQCKWNLRAAYYAQELLQTFSLSIGEIALIPSSGGVFNITLYTASPDTIATTNTSQQSSITQSTTTHSSSTTAHSPPPQQQTPLSTTSNPRVQVLETLLWDRSLNAGFPETKELKSRMRNVIDPKRDLGHVDRSLNRDKTSTTTKESGSNGVVGGGVGGGGGGGDDGAVVSKGMGQEKGEEVQEGTSGSEGVPKGEVGNKEEKGCKDC